MNLCSIILIVGKKRYKLIIEEKNKGVCLMKINVRYNTIDEMLALCKQVKEGCLDKDRLEKLLNHEDYQVEFKRYDGRVSKEEFFDFFSNFPNLDYNEISNKDFQVHYENYKYLFDNIELYEKECKKFKDFTEDLFVKQVEMALKGLPGKVKFDELNFIFTLGIGMSFGWVYENNSHFDVIQLIKNSSVEDFKSTIAHEVHHIGINSIFKDLDMDKISVEDYFYIFFSGEGLAVKYCNNAEGNISKAIYDGEKNVGLDSFSWNYLNNEFEDNLKAFKEHIKMIRAGEIKNLEELQKLIQNYWMNFHTDEQDKSEPPKLKQGRWYAFGNDVWGVIHDVFGKDKVFETLDNPKNFPQVYNEAVKKIGKDKYCI